MEQTVKLGLCGALQINWAAMIQAIVEEAIRRYAPNCTLNEILHLRKFASRNLDGMLPRRRHSFPWDLATSSGDGVEDRLRVVVAEYSKRHWW